MMSGSAQAWFWVAVAGAAGTLLRYGVSGWFARSAGGAFPWDTFAVNALGCLAIGIVAGLADRGAWLPPPLRLALMVGLLGGFTTFSTLALDAYRLVLASQWAAAVGYVALTNLVGLAAVVVGYRVALGG
jgi:CrcB protein